MADPHSIEIPPPSAAPRTEAAGAVISSEQLFGGSRQLLIRHAEGIYRLRITRTGKLILTK